VTFATRGITVNTVCAGITDDSIVNQLPKEAQDALLGWLRSGWNPMGRPGTPADIGGVLAAVCLTMQTGSQGKPSWLMVAHR
jgi:NAD(P)-dependent dehydrogenase (short-subunit alcohol dehydrogenase family)